jgi:hypothetical protein
LGYLEDEQLIVSLAGRLGQGKAEDLAVYPRKVPADTRERLVNNWLPNLATRGMLRVMAVTLEDLDRRVTALEKGAEREKTIERAVAEIVSESEQRVRAEMSKLRGDMSDLGAEMKADMSELRAEMKADMSELRAEMKAESQRLTERVSSSERRMVDILNDRFDQVMAALDRPDRP